jgi:hypothetical protein
MNRRRATLLIGLAVLTTACSGSGHHGVHTAGTASVSTSTTIDGGGRLAAPPNVGFVSAPTGPHPHAMTVWDWTGRRVRTIDLATDSGCCVSGSLAPDGSRFLIGDVVYDIRGRVIGDTHGLYGVWADDSRHLCAFQPHDVKQPVPIGPADLFLVDPGHSQRLVAQIEGYNPHGGPTVLRCSVADDHALVGSTFTTQIGSVSSVQLSTGHATTPSWSTDLQAHGVQSVSGNGRYVLEYGTGTTSVDSIVVDRTTGAHVGHAVGQPLDISWNGHLVVVLKNGFDIEVDDWRSGAKLWRSADRHGQTAGIVSEAAVSNRPLSDDIAVAASALPERNPNDAMLWLISPGRPPKLLDPAVAAGVI